MYATYTGNSHYCYSNSLHMSLQNAGMVDLPAPGLLECMTGMPFGTAFLKFETPLFFPSPANINPEIGLSQALSTLGWTCTIWRGDDSESALSALKEALGGGPVLLGPLDAGYLSYDPNHRLKRGGDHFIVVLKIQGNHLQVHDPQFYPFAVLPVEDLMRAWYAKDLGYPTSAYTMRSDFREQRCVSREEMLNDTLKTARELIQDIPTGPVFFGGSTAYLLAAEVLRENPSESFTGMLTHFALPIGARRFIDGAGFLSSVDRSEAAELMLGKAESFGETQYYATSKDWKRTAALLGHLAKVEDQIAHSIQ